MLFQLSLTAILLLQSPTTTRPVQSSSSHATTDSANDQSDPKYWFDRASQSAKDGAETDALDAMKRMLSLDDQSSWSYAARGQILMLLHHDTDAVEPLKRAIELQPDEITPMHNLAQVYQNLKKWNESTELYTELLKREPDNWRYESKLVQNHQAANKIPERDQARDAVFAMAAAGKIKQKYYCREQFAIGENDVLAMEYFKPDGQFGVRFTFYVLDHKSGKTNCRICLESSDSDTDVAQKLGELKPGQRVYSIDGYYPDGSHSTFGMFDRDQQPAYEEVRQMAVNAIKGDAEVVSSTTPGSTTKENVEIKMKVPGTQPSPTTQGTR